MYMDLSTVSAAKGYVSAKGYVVSSSILLGYELTFHVCSVLSKNHTTKFKHLRFTITVKISPQNPKHRTVTFFDLYLEAHLLYITRDRDGVDILSLYMPR